MSSQNLKKTDMIFGLCHTTDVEHLLPGGVCKTNEEKFVVLEEVIKKDPQDIIDDIIESGLKGRGGAGFPTGLKWKFASLSPEKEKYVICNADEGEPGTFKDRDILLKVPAKVFAGMTMCGYCINAKKGYLYLRGEYKFMLPELRKVLDSFHEVIKKIGYDFHIDILLGSGAYVCGEETALMESMEGHRGEARNKPPYPTVEGFRNKPTVINNVETFVNVTMIQKFGVAEFKKLGTQDSRGSKVFSVSGDTPKPGVYELELGMKLSDFVDEYGDGDTKAVQVGGASGFCVPRKKFNETIIGFEGIPTGGSMMLFNSSRSMYNVLTNYLEFFAEESCGQCTPCRVGCQQLIRGIRAVKCGQKSPDYLDALLKLTASMKLTAKCGLGQSVANSFSSIVSNFTEEMIY
ncbi:MAG: NADH-ubiquinone oxidoreductase-F iron-sulfur binding region domain-containing protein [Bacteroidales bacterium]|jgi:[NiFe] hydrogenase diaphorase moiety large subunit|nr:NADH-ubiquinone oxidoreductase-F iron-sulfur binding region domain-containing protein [Bacteroidales bacterium]MDD2688519.1 NADH-ubiquinone oxidoreductase-F iron-sulfur binding region domain-containing protein [Bacteroidales bacterium]MDD3330334.1 NADH-ubiquinone oxidoreductase-F iron-sulfur binding region domain-containing protein [Bacteroidales bacterium]MDD3691124.1 NADH-ubiquinone oxidoreductase-F iron-sulfur binding region domain-containing protein [Bacteroidales bacterium]MDD4044772.1 